MSQIRGDTIIEQSLNLYHLLDPLEKQKMYEYIEADLYPREPTRRELEESLEEAIAEMG